MKRNKHLGMLLGLHCGDSLGATLEFKSPTRDINKFQKDIIGGGVFNWTAGKATDDTDMMICLLKSLSENKDYNHKDIIQKYIDWKDTEPSDIGNTISKALELQKSNNLDFTGLKGFYRKSNGSLMRCAPLSLLEFNPIIISQQCSITHGETICKLSDKIFIKSLQSAFEDSSKESIIKEALDLANGVDLDLYNTINNISNIKYSELKTSGYVLDSLVCSLWSLIHFDNLEDAIIHVINRGDDSDTCGAISGALLGAFYGLESLPQRWLDVIKRKDEIIEYYEILFK
jgi:ADP-ribosyl-[dinitrogen reductase] hydrolase